MSTAVLERSLDPRPVARISAGSGSYPLALPTRLPMGSGHNVPLEAPHPFAQSIMDADHL
ncbi:hypothetical protein ABIA39_008680 [Nocardia sp. GAS34]|uniref:hypothetical protein n=1 Tax=unclassified Nocardia TaxID=2637762 RepID=UPI003D1AFBC7